MQQLGNWKLTEVCKENAICNFFLILSYVVVVLNLVYSSYAKTNDSCKNYLCLMHKLIIAAAAEWDFSENSLKTLQ